MRTLLPVEKGKWQNRRRAALFVIGLAMFLAVFFDFYYDLNDDTAMKDILSGTYTGLPDGHNIQMLYPLSFVISLFYKVCPMLPWYGIFLLGSQLLAVWISFCSLFTWLSAQKRKKTWLLFLTAAIGSLFLYEFIFVQYTVTAGLLAVAALVRICISPHATDKEFFRYHIVTVMLVVLAFYLRTEMLLLLCPFLGLCGLWSVFGELAEERETAGKRCVLVRYSLLAVSVLILMGVGLLADRAAYGSTQWRSFRQFFDDRTSVYDFYGIPDYEIHREFYEGMGISEAEYTLLVNYNFDLDEEIDAEAMSKIALYAAESRKQGVFRRLYLCAYTYVYRFLHGQEIVFDLLLAVSYFFLAKAALKGKNPQLLGKLVLLFGMRTAIWLFLLYMGRVPERITHPLYLAELVLLVLLFLSDTKALQWKKYEKSAILSMYILLFVCTAVYHAQTVSEKYAAREETNLRWQQWKEYCRSNPQQFYYLDVYSSVAYSEKLFSDTSSDYRNFDLAGGWCSKSPLAAQKRAAMGFESAKYGLLAGQAFFVADATKPERSPEFLIPWYQEKGNDIVLQEVDRCGSFSVFRIIEKTVN